MILKSVEQWSELNERKVSHVLTKNKNQDLIIDSFISFWEKHISIKKDSLKVIITDNTYNVPAYIDMSGVTKSNKSKLNLMIAPTNKLGYILKLIAHESTHAKQIQSSELWYTDTHIQWKGKNFMSLDDYQNLAKDLDKSQARIKEYLNLPWEIPAYKNEKNAIDSFLQSNECEELQEIDDPMLRIYLSSL